MPSDVTGLRAGFVLKMIPGSQRLLYLLLVSCLSVQATSSLPRVHVCKLAENQVKTKLNDDVWYVLYIRTPVPNFQVRVEFPDYGVEWIKNLTDQDTGRWIEIEIESLEHDFCVNSTGPSSDRCFMGDDLVVTFPKSVTLGMKCDGFPDASTRNVILAIVGVLLVFVLVAIVVEFTGGNNEETATGRTYVYRRAPTMSSSPVDASNSSGSGGDNTRSPTEVIHSQDLPPSYEDVFSDVADPPSYDALKDLER